MLQPERVAAVMARLDVWWALAGGWAIDMWLDRQTRDHHDVEVVVRRGDQAVIHALLHDEWEMSCIDPPGSGWRPWRAAQLLVPPSFQSKASGSAFEFDLFLESIDRDVWTFRRDLRISRPLHTVTVLSKVGIPVVAPEIQLLYMAKSAEPKHEQDFRAVLPGLTLDATAWLAQALAVSYGDHHPWLSQLSS